MSREKRGGSRLEKNMSRKSQQTRPKRDPATSGAKAAKRGDGVPRWLKILLIVLVAILAVMIVVMVVLHLSVIVLPDLPSISVDGEADPNGKLPTSNIMANAPRKDYFYTFLVAGKDTGGGGNTDTMMLVAYDIPNQKLSVMSLPRDTMVDARHPDHNRKLNGVWNLSRYYAKKDEKKEGVEYLKEAVGDMIGFVPDFYVTVNWEAFGKLVDAIGGVEFEVPFDMKYDDPTQNLHINVAKGKRVLTGKEAMGVVRWRHNNSGSGYAAGDLGRIQTQQAFMKEVVKKCLKIENVTKINEFAAIFTEEVDTDLTLGNLVAFAERAIFGGLKMDNVVFTTMPNTAVYVGVESYVQANPNELLGVLNDSFNPYKEDIPMKALHILQYSSSAGYYVYSGTGTGTTPIYTDPKPAAVVGSSRPKTEESEPPEDDPETTDDPSASPSASSSPRPSGRPGRDDDPSDTGNPSTSPSASPSTSASDEPEPSSSGRPSPSPAPSAQPPATTVTEGQPAGIPLD